MKLLKFHAILMKIMKIHRIPCQNHDNHENLSIPHQNHENHEIHRIPYQIHENHENLIIPS